MSNENRIIAKYMDFNKLSQTKQQSIAKRYHLPKDTAHVKVDEHDRPYELFGGMRITCSINVKKLMDEGFHNSSLRSIG